MNDCLNDYGHGYKGEKDAPKCNLNKVLHEKVLGECWHGNNCPRQGYSLVTVVNSLCVKCGSHFDKNPDYLHDPAAYWRLWDKIEEDERKFKDFIHWFHWYVVTPEEAQIERLDLAVKMFKSAHDMQRGCEAIADFFIPDWRS